MEETTDSGLKYIDEKLGEGDFPQKGDILVVHYTGTLEDGTVFDSSIKRNQPIEFPVGKGRVIKEGKKVAILNFGTRLEECKKASEILSTKGINITIIDARFAKPLDENLIWQLATTHEAIVTIEEGSIGGFGSHVVDFLTKKGLLDSNLKIRSLTIPDVFIDQDTPDNMYKIANLYHVI